MVSACLKPYSRHPSLLLFSVKIMDKKFKEQLRDHQESLIKEGKIFEKAKGGGLWQNRPYSHILEGGEEYKNLFAAIRDNVKSYFVDNNISFWGGKTIIGNSLSSQASCLNHLFFIRNNEKVAKEVLQSFVGDRIKIESLDGVVSQTEIKHCEYIAFEMISDNDRMNEKTLTRGNTCTSIDAFAIANDSNGKKHILVIEWKLVEDDSGNKASTLETSQNEKEVRRGKTRIENYSDLIMKSKYIKSENDSYFNSSLFNLPFYELMRQTLWAENNRMDFNADDYIHIHVVPLQNIMRHKRYHCAGNIKGVKDAWESHLTEEGKKRYVIADPHCVVNALRNNPNYTDLANYLEERYYRLSNS